MKTSLVFRRMIAIVVPVALATACTDTGTGSNPSSGGTSPGTGGGTTGGFGGQSAGGGINPVGGAAGSVQAGGAAGSAVVAGGSGGDVGTAGGSGGTAGTDGSGGSGGGTTNATGPCDIYNAAGNNCVAAYSTVRRLLSTYTGPIYQVRRGGDPNAGSGGQLQDIAILPNGFADAAAHAAFCGNESCSFSVLYDQSGQGNDLTVAKRGCYGCSEPQQTCSSCSDTACQNDHETDASSTITVGGNTVHTLRMVVQDGYRNNGTAWPTAAPPASGMPTGNPAAGQGVYMVAEGSGRRPDAAYACCWNFGNVSNNNCYGPSGQMNALMLGKGFWGDGAGDGPWFMGDFEAGVWAGGVNGDINNASTFENNPNLPSMTMDFAFGILKTQPNNYAIRVADATTGTLMTAYDGAAPNIFAGTGDWQMEGGIALGIGGDNSNHASGTFLEGAITSSRPSNETDAAVHENVKALGYGQ